MNIERVKAIYDEISGYEIKLESDPRSLGPLYLQDVIATCRNYQNAVGRIQLEVHREMQDLSRSLRAAETEFQIAFDHALSNDERVRRLPSIEDRKATVNVMLRPQLDGISSIKAQLHDLEYVDKAVRHRHRELTATMTDIKLQRSLIRDEIDSGAMYGDERLGDHERGKGEGPLGDDIDVSEIDELFAADAAARAASDAAPETSEDAPPAVEISGSEAVVSPETLPLVPSVPEPLPVAKTEEEVIEAFLQIPAKNSVEEDYSDVFDNL